MSIDAQRGSALWGLNQFRSTLLSALLDDLQRAEKEDLPESAGDKIRKALGSIVNAATAIPDKSYLRGSVWREMEKLEKLFDRWDKVNGSSEWAIYERRRVFRKMRRQRHRIATRIRRNQQALEKEVDGKFLGHIYGALGKLAESLPEILIELGKAVAKYGGPWL